MAAAASASAALELEGRGPEGRGTLEGRITPLECHASSAAAGAAQLQRRASELQTRRHKLAQLEETFERQYGDLGLAVQSLSTSPTAAVAGGGLSTEHSRATLTTAEPPPGPP